MTSPPRHALVLLSTCAVLLSTFAGCDDDPGPTPDAGTEVPPADSGAPDSGTPDSGTEAPWDGGYTVLEEHGDWINRGHFAPCRFNPVGDPTTIKCEDLSRYDVSQCDPEALAQVEPHGIYLADMLGESRLSDGGTRVVQDGIGFMLTSDGGTSTMIGKPLLTRNTDGGSFFLVGSYTNAFNGAVTVSSLAGCKVPSSGLITGCYASCTNGRFIRSGTFEAHRLPSHRGEGESSGGLRPISEYDIELGAPADVYVHKNHAYVVSIHKVYGGSAGGLTVLDVSDRAHPLFKASISLPGDGNWNGVWAKDDALYIAGNRSGVLVYDISNPAQPEYVRHLSAGEYGAHTVLVDENRLYAMSPSGAVTFVFDVTTPLAPVLRQRITVPTESPFAGAHDAFAYEGRLYISNGYGGGHVVMDVTDLDNVRHLGQYLHGPEVFAHHSAVGTFAGRTLAFDGTEYGGAHLRVLDVTDPAHIVKIGEFRLSPVTSIHNIILKGHRLYIAWYQEGVRVLDVSNPTKPRQVAHYNTVRDGDFGRTDNLFEGTFGIRVPGDGYVYAADSVRGLLIFNEL
jgi:hypothetical protein